MRQKSIFPGKPILFLAVLWLALPGRLTVADDADALVARIAQLGGHIVRSESGEIVAIDLANRPTGDEDLRLLAAAPHLQKLVVWGAGVTDVGVDHLAQLKNLAELTLENTLVTDAGLAKLAPLAKLKSLNLQRATGITDEGLAHVAKLPELTYLVLLYTKIGDPGMMHLARAKKLRLLDARGCKISDAGLAHLAPL
ncbi:MAG TPA: hypothetical protein VJ809_09350, partial [Pirellulales bacterium]|nr:hypothetical protein [Pirellulales bacterium]